MLPSPLGQHLYVAIAELWLEDRDEEDAENVAALQVARKMVTLARAMPEEDLHEVDIYVCMLLIWAGRVLIKELKRLSLLVGDLLGKPERVLDLSSAGLTSRYTLLLSLRFRGI